MQVISVSIFTLFSINFPKKKGLLNPSQLNVRNQIQVKNLMLTYLCELAFVLAQK